VRQPPPPLVAWHISCGFPSPADDYRESELDINELVIAHPEATFYVRVSGDSMEGAGICEGDVLVVDRALDARENAIIVALVNGEFTVKRLFTSGDTLLLMPENPRYDPLPITEEMEFRVWGIATYVIHRLR
jgi:DNA polymerase V